MKNCPLCENSAISDFFTDQQRRYQQCQRCVLVFVSQEFWLSPAEEKTVYDLHENDPQDFGYRKFLSRLAEPLLAKLPANSLGLDFGCGPAPTLSLMFEEQGHEMFNYDPIYFDNPKLLQQKYDFVCATEVVEHFCTPSSEFEKLFSLLKPNGWLGVMTKLVIDQQAFSSWHYIRDLTHICFYSRETFEYLAEKFGAELSFTSADVILFKNTQEIK